MSNSIGKINFRLLVLIMRILFGVGWFLAGLTKIMGKTGEVSWYTQPEVFLTDYLNKALHKSNVPDFYKYFLNDVALHHVTFLNYTIPIIQMILGIFLILGFMILPAICICLFMQINFILSGNMNLLSLTLYTSAFGLLLFRKDAFSFSLDRRFKVDVVLTRIKPKFVYGITNRNIQ